MSSKGLKHDAEHWVMDNGERSGVKGTTTDVYDLIAAISAPFSDVPTVER